MNCPKSGGVESLSRGANDICLGFPKGIPGRPSALYGNTRRRINRPICSGCGKKTKLTSVAASSSGHEASASDLAAF